MTDGRKDRTGDSRAAPAAPSPRKVLRLERRPVELSLRHAWTIARNTSTTKTNVLTRIALAGMTGLGEAAPNVRYREDWRTVMAALDRSEPLLAADPDRFTEIMDRVDAAIPGSPAARAAIDIALHDLAARRAGVPLFRLLGADPARMPRTSFSIGIDAIPVMQDKVREAAAYPILKIKVGRDDDRAILDGIRGVTDKPLRVDANEGWKDPRRAIEMIRWMEGMGVEIVEQPLPAADLEGARRVREAVGMPIFADEAALTADDLARIGDAYDGVNVKLQKSGGLRAARRMIEVARALGMKVMLGCMIETSIGITAAAHLAPLADEADLDGNLLITGDPFRGVTVRDGRPVLPDGTGLGVEGAW